MLVGGVIGWPPLPFRRRIGGRRRLYRTPHRPYDVVAVRCRRDASTADQATVGVTAAGYSSEPAPQQCWLPGKINVGCNFALNKSCNFNALENLTNYAPGLNGLGIRLAYPSEG